MNQNFRNWRRTIRDYRTWLSCKCSNPSPVSSKYRSSSINFTSLVFARQPSWQHVKYITRLPILWLVLPLEREFAVQNSLISAPVAKNLFYLMICLEGCKIAKKCIPVSNICVSTHSTPIPLPTGATAASSSMLKIVKEHFVSSCRKKLCGYHWRVVLSQKAVWLIIKFFINQIRWNIYFLGFK